MALVETATDLASARPILRFTAKLTALGSNLAFRKWTYSTTAVTFELTIILAMDDPDASVCLYIGYGVTLIDKVLLAKKFSSPKINVMPIPLKVRDISASQYKSEEFALAAIYIPGLNQNCLEVYVCIRCKLHLSKGLKANMLIGNDVFCTKNFLINLADASDYIPCYGVDITISARYHSKFLK